LLHFDSSFWFSYKPIKNLKRELWLFNKNMLKYYNKKMVKPWGFVHLKDQSWLVVSCKITSQPLRSSLNWIQKQWEQVTSKCERKVVKKFALGKKKLMHSLYPIEPKNQQKLHCSQIYYIKYAVSQPLSRLLSQNPSRFHPGEISSNYFIWHSEW